jgi:hypothetical protein
MICFQVFGSTTHKRFVYFHYNVESAGSVLTTPQCKVIFNEPVFYEMINDKPIYTSGKNLQVFNYQRISTTQLDNHHWLFFGTQNVQFLVGGKKIKNKNSMSFVLDTNQSMIKGSWIIPDYCKGNLIGVEQNKQGWTTPALSKLTH